MGLAKEPETKVWCRHPQKPALWPGRRQAEEVASSGPFVPPSPLLPSPLGTLVTPPVTPPLGTPSAASPSPLTSILENTVSVNSSAVMVESLQGLMVRMAWEARRSEMTRPN